MARSIWWTAQDRIDCEGDAVHNDHPQESPHGQAPITAVTLYWRPWCPYCTRLRWQLRRVRLSVREVNIWKDAAAAARVRDITGGDEVVPTVAVGDATLVNPTKARVLAAVRAHAPHLLAADQC